MAYVDYNYYTNTFGSSTIPETSFSSYERLARVSLDNFTFNRLKNDNTLITDDVKECLCVMIEKAYSVDQEQAMSSDGTGKLISSASTDGLNTTYAISDLQKNEIDQFQITKVKLYNIAKEYLWSTGLLYRGLDRCKPKQV
jgi:hypothetical protein